MNKTWNKAQVSVATLLAVSLLSGSTFSDLVAKFTSINDSDTTTVSHSLANNTLQYNQKSSKESNVIQEIITNTVPFYSQIKDISDPSWRGVSCGVASLAMLIDYYTNPVAPDILLAKGIAANAFDDNAGWSHAGLIKLAGEYGLTGETVWLGSDKQQALAALKAELDEGPVMASVHYTFDYNNPIPHLVVITEIDGEIGRYNDPAEEAGGGAVPLDKFASSWKNRYIKIRPSA